MDASSQITDYAVLPSPPFLEVAGIPNFRDLGGYPLTNRPSSSVRRDLIYRCAEPSNVTQDGISTMRKLGITHVYDLRSTVEIERARAAGRGGVVEWEGCTRVFVPVFTDQDYSPEQLALRYKDYASGTEGFTRAYMTILNHAAPSYRTILLHLANEPATPMVVHCTAGKDRTGVLCGLILSLCGVDDETVAQEYALTDLGLSTAWKESVIAHLMANPALKDNKEGAWNMIGAKADNMRSAWKQMKRDFGGAENYLIERCGLTPAQIARIRSNLIVEEPAIHAQQVPHHL